MKKLLAVLLVLLLVTACSVSDKRHKAMHVISLGEGDNETICTAYAIGPHAVETAEHCLEAGPPYSIDGKAVTVHGTILDKKDHAILLLNGIWFKDFIVLNFREPRVGDRVYSYTNQARVELMDQYAEGYRSGSYKDQMVFFLPVIAGASGSIMFNEDGSVAGIVSQASGPYSISNRLEFTSCDLAKAAAK